MTTITEKLTARPEMLEHIEQQLHLLHPDPADILEVRALDIPGRGKPHTAAGYFDGAHLAAAAQAAYRYSEDLRAAGVYVALNPCHTGLLSRSPNTMADYPENTTTDADVLRRQWLFVDIDPHRPTGIAATDEEMRTAVDLAEEIIDKLRGHGFPYPLMASSGNGRYLLYRVDLPNDDDAAALVKAFYGGLNTLLESIDSTKLYATIDRSVGNAARIARIGGTLNRKGQHTADRPHRRAEYFDPGEPIEIVPRERLEGVAVLAPQDKQRSSTTTPGANGKPRIDVVRYCADYGQTIREIKEEAGRTIFILETCPFDENHGRNGETSIVQAAGGLTTFHCKHESCQSYRWQDFKARVGKLSPQHLEKPSQAGPECAEPISLPCSLRELVCNHPALRPAVIGGLLRVGETANIVAAPKRGKSWLVYSLMLSVASGRKWLDTFSCVQGRVLLLDAELHPEVIAYRLPAVADALGMEPECLDWIDVLPLRGLGIDLLKLQSFIESIEPGRYALIVLDAWYRFLPLGFSENDNAQVMQLYNQIDSYAAHLGAAWVNIHHASKGDQSGKGTTDVGSGAGSQSRAADTHLIIRQHEQDDVGVIEAVVRSWPPVAPLAIRWTFPAWQLDTEADPRRLQKPRERSNRESRDSHLDADRQSIVNVMVHDPDLQTKTEIRDSARVGNPRFGFAWASLLADKTIIPSGDVVKGNNRRYESFTLSHQETGE